MKCELCGRDDDLIDCDACGRMVCENCLIDSEYVTLCKQCEKEYNAMTPEEKEQTEKEVMKLLEKGETII